MPNLSQQSSEVAHLLTQISHEYEAAQQGLSGLAQGTSQHQFINRRMERIGALHAVLYNLLGDEAMVLIDSKLRRDSLEEEMQRQEKEVSVGQEL